MSLHTPQPTTIHTHTSGEQGIFANAYLIETESGVVAVDGTLTLSEARAFRARLETLEKPLLAVLVTHAHPDHVAGITVLVQGKEVPIVALASVKQLMERTEQAKHAQWGPVYRDEWIRTWTYPTVLVKDGETVTFGGLGFQVYDLGPGGDCDANAIWVVDTHPKVAFVGDLIFHGMHSYVADDHLLRWLVNLERARRLLQGVQTLYLGHGEAGGIELLNGQRAYLLAYCEAIMALAGGQPVLSEQAKEELVRRMQQLYPDAGLAFMISLGADAVAAELAGHASGGK
ncbi:MAG TPA: MBL fold metallo-hydrolase [Ktedonosporobacter sp.]|nr:MBL fold metallo-hydrolase [Ktedonosporobacter sp.]